MDDYTSIINIAKNLERDDLLKLKVQFQQIIEYKGAQKKKNKDKLMSDIENEINIFKQFFKDVKLEDQEDPEFFCISGKNGNVRFDRIFWANQFDFCIINPTLELSTDTLSKQYFGYTCDVGKITENVFFDFLKDFKELVTKNLKDCQSAESVLESFLCDRS